MTRQQKIEKAQNILMDARKRFADASNAADAAWKAHYAITHFAVENTTRATQDTAHRLSLEKDSERIAAKHDLYDAEAEYQEALAPIITK